MIGTKGTKTIPVVGDDEGARKVAVALLSRLGNNVLEAKDNLCARDSPQFLVVDEFSLCRE